MFILDTNVISELRHGKPNQSKAVRAWAGAQPASRLFLTAISILELEKGVLALEHRIPPQGSALRAWRCACGLCRSHPAVYGRDGNVMRGITCAQYAARTRCNDRGDGD